MDFGSAVEHVRALVHPATLLFGVGEDVAKCRPEPERPSPMRARSAHAAVGRSRSNAARSLRLSIAVSDRDKLFRAVQTDAEDHEAAEPLLFEAHVEVDPVGKDVDVVPIGEVSDMNARWSSCQAP